MICVAMLESKMENPKAGFWECSLLGNGSVPFLCQLSWGYETSQTLIKSQSILANTSEQLLVYHISGCFKYTVTDAPVSGQNITIHHHCWIFLDLMQVPWFSWLRPHPWVSTQECELIMAKKWPCRRISKHRSRFSRESPSFSLDRAK